MKQAKDILSDQPRMDGSNTTSNPKITNNSNNNPLYRNGGLVCSAHPLLVKEVQEMHETIDKIEEYFILRKKVLELVYNNKYISGVITGVIILLIAYYTVL
jgi:hypothetical protein